MKTDEPPPSVENYARRTFLVAASVVGGGLLVGAGAVTARLYGIEHYKLPSGLEESSFGAWLKLARDGKFEVAVPHQEMGQGIYSLAVLLVAEILQLPPEAVRAEQAPIHARFANPIVLLDGLPFNEHVQDARRDAVVWTFDKILSALGISATGGSTSARHLVDPIRSCAAVTLDMLRRAAASQFGVATEGLRIAEGRIFTPGGKSATYAELANAAAKLSPRSIVLPPLGAGTYVGQGIARFDVPEKTLGRAQFGIDVREPGQLYAAIRHSPRLGGLLREVSLSNGLPGVSGIVKGSDYVAVVASSYFHAASALKTATVSWDDSGALSISTKDVFAAYRAALDQGPSYESRRVLDSQGDPTVATGRKVTARYDAPFLAHATMEPINATALVTDSGVKVWAGHQSGFLARWQAASAAGVSCDSVEVKTPYLGGGFGRRAHLDYIEKAINIARQFKSKPVQTIWSRAEDIRNDFFRPAAMADVSATLDSQGLPSSMVYRVAVPSVAEQFLASLAPMMPRGYLSARSSGDGAIFPFYCLPNRSIESFTVDLGIPVGFWRSVGHSLNNFFLETFIDELASAAGIEPIAYRALLLGASNRAEASRRASAVLARLRRFDADHTLQPGKPGTKVGRGVALSECFRSFVGQLADVEIDGKEIRVKRVLAVADCGLALDPPNVAAQVRSGITFGLSAALFGKVEIENGRVIPQNFDTYPVLTLQNAPEILVEIIDSGADIGGVGEIGTPGIAPAVGNAIFAATGQRLRSLPFGL